MKNPILIDVPTEILTPRLILRVPRAGDGAMVNPAVVETYEALHRFIPWAQSPTPPTVDDGEVFVRTAAAKFILRENLQYAAFDRVTGEYVGGTGLHRPNWQLRRFEIGYWIRRSREGQGLVTESSNALTRMAFEHLRARRVEIVCDFRNERSSAVPLRLGYVQEALMKNKDLGPDGETPRDTMLFARTSLDGLPPLDVSWR